MNTVEGDLITGAENAFHDSRCSITIAFSRPILILMLIFLSSLVSAQKKAKDNFEAIIKWTPSSLLTPETPTMRLGVELMFPKFTRHGLSIEFDYGFRYASGYPYSNITPVRLDPTNYYNKDYNKYHIDIRKYFHPVNEIFIWYASVKGFYIRIRIKLIIGYIAPRMAYNTYLILCMSAEK